MLIVTGTKRSGTSLWMQILIEAGFPYIGTPYMADWENTIKAANPNGFFESPLRKGIFYATNPDPKTGVYLKPGEFRRHAVKVFIPGLIRTDLAYIDRVVATIRPWREYVHSIRRLHSIEDDHFAGISSNNDDSITPLLRAQFKRTPIHPVLEWWSENFSLIHNYAVRGYAFNLVSYSKLLESPEEIIPPVIRWAGGENVDAAVAVVNPKMRTQAHPEVSDIDLPADIVDTFDEFHSYFYEQRPLTGTFLNRLNEVDAALKPIIAAQRSSELKRRENHLKTMGLTPSDLKAPVTSTTDAAAHYSNTEEE